MRLVDEMEAPEQDEATAPADLPEMIRKKQIVEQTAELTGMSKGEVRRVLDAALGYIRETLNDGNDVHYPTLGKIKIKVPDREGAKPQIRVALAKKSPADASDEGDGQPDDMYTDDE
ncbi:HU family DNA-binding protein [Pontivivens insulae]|uniref:DNA-binding protein HU n=1 Tax=Pontivivens insulae TaxID=1639689 RepID=A0A2R8AA34_9RHOB|nr:HU family DNA-binding protein [Pontivivens insulae]RED12884.1 DNA-binding protein [Pontivivens insulae]SPF28975.1 hypothetical protein POI8812_01278 [Pontivivens insulae]